MDLSAISGSALKSLPASDAQAQISVPDIHEIEAFKNMMAGAQPVPEAGIVNAVQLQQAMFNDTIQKINPIMAADTVSGTKGDEVSNLLNTQYGLFNLSFSLDLTAKIAGQFSQAVNKLTSMQ
ncbi:type III secretion system inner rod subunit SctI [Citrobacter youngae]|uniref:Type III secretion apparatus protein, YscI/HrpB domain protein n=1 Tax=Citrobacter youngae ATCC 29220 TaxID=500640 RepID=D4BKF9_9ENTR|nr:type III secretion system inner rod subunit SctI [Citrobacter youngae]EFE05590.1 type III secretion apparatus protein, YscI/HrpB domain protein [Citrobacter youngae ATCC 29220]